MVKIVPMSEVWPTPALLRAARGLLGLRQAELAKQSKVSRKSIILIEAHVGDTMDSRRVEVVEKLGDYFTEKKNIEFIRPKGKKGAGVRSAT
jgi:DNA-binding XRE family transcriptional regulator